MLIKIIGCISIFLLIGLMIWFDYWIEKKIEQSDLWEMEHEE